ncbi:TonB-dependent siderophore receptor [Chroococcidiopsis thermalis]|uniref:TonB-dependent siderophore receptor n=1 Tax=Chroococcidiopsis thermalis (strain PCC 7203) TaxID=251229 RepID=K9U4A2_CHRTP|nr:TonB-dependent siderophore receptor [Chroococcidiopsis thermalis]AFY89074.1 TonB-dependent siderophore receptor [Chroococcidiopsis thermalis PCC 7203]
MLGTPAKGESVGAQIREVDKNIPQLSEIELPATTAQNLVQQPTNETSGEVIAITGVTANPTDKGVEIVLQTTQGKVLQPVTLTLGNTYIANIPNAVLTLPQGEFRQDNPASGITRVAVTQATANSIRVAVTGEAALPQVQLYDAPNQGLIFSFTPGTSAAQTPPAPEDDEQEIVVTDEQDGYLVPDTNVGTRTDTPLRDIPQSIQIIPQQVLEEQQVDSLNEAIKNVPGVIQNTPDDTPIFNSFTIRGFDAGENQNFTRNGLKLRFANSTTAIFSNIERVEVLRGPASVLFGGGEPGGTINIVTKQPLREPFYSVEASVGSYDFYQGALDLTGPLNDSKTILYRLNASYESAESFVNFVNREISAVAGAIKFELGKNTDLTFDIQYVGATQRGGSGLPVEGTILPNPNGEIPRNRNLAEPDSRFIIDRLIAGYNLEHRFSENWSLRNAFYFADNNYRIRDSVAAISLEPDLRTVERFADEVDTRDQTFDFVTNVVGKFSTGAIQHQLLLGVDLSRFDSRFFTDGAFRGTPIDLFDPVYSTEILERTDPPSETTTLTDSLGIYLQDQVTITNNLKLLLGGRFDAFEQTEEDLLENTETSQSGDAFSPRLGIVYQPIEPISLYASYTRSFAPSYGRSADDEPFEPGRGTQYEIGVKADINDRLSATLALYDLTRTNVNTTDPDNPNFEIQTGEQNSQGVELFISGEILPGWNIIAGYAYTDARITQDETYEVGNRINNVPESSFNLWTSYEIQSGNLQGLGFGIGFFYVGDRQGDLENTFTLPSYFRTDAAIFYKRGQFRAALNVNNLFDVEYFENSNSGLSVYPAEPFTVQGKVSWEF